MTESRKPVRSVQEKGVWRREWVPRGETVVLVEEDAQARTRAESALVARGYRVRATSDPTEVVDCVRRDRAGIVVLGLAEESDTLDLIRRLRGRFEPIPLPAPPRIVVTGSNMGPRGERFTRSLGADVILRRPFSAGDLADALTRLPRRGQAVRAAIDRAS